MWHKTDWAKVKENPASIGFPRDDWIHTFDAEKHAEEVFDEVFKKFTEAGSSTDAANEAQGAGPVPIAA